MGSGRYQVSVQYIISLDQILLKISKEKFKNTAVDVILRVAEWYHAVTCSSSHFHACTACCPAAHHHRLSRRFAQWVAGTTIAQARTLAFFIMVERNNNESASRGKEQETFNVSYRCSVLPLFLVLLVAPKLLTIFLRCMLMILFLLLLQFQHTLNVCTFLSLDFGLVAFQVWR